MGSGTKETSAPIRRFPAGFWRTFNQWWHAEFARLGQRPSSKAIGRWHVENASKVWGDQAVSYGETQRHANRMKCKRTGHLVRSSNADDDEDDEHTIHDSARLASSEKRKGVVAEELVGGQEIIAESGSESAKALVPPVDLGINLNANSDAPGALSSYMHGDSDLPAPAAPSKELLSRFSAWTTGTTSVLMHPDPTGPHGSRSHSAKTEPPSNPFTSSCISADSLVALDGPAMGARLRPKRERSSSDLRLSDPKPLSAPDDVLLPKMRSAPPRSHPFAEAAAAAAAALGLPTAGILPSTHDAAHAQRSPAFIPHDPSCLRPGDTRMAFPWLAPAAAELDALLAEISTDGHVSRQRDARWRSRLRGSAEPLRLPEGGPPKRDLDGLLLRRLLRETQTPTASVQRLGPDSAVSYVRHSTTDAVARLLQARRALLQPLAQQQQHQDRAWGPGGETGSVAVLPDIDSLPLEVLL